MNIWNYILLLLLGIRYIKVINQTHTISNPGGWINKNIFFIESPG